MLSALTLSPALSFAEEETYVVTGSRFVTPMNQIGYDVTVFTEEEIQNKQLTTLDEVLRLVPNIHINENGIGVATAFVRGSKGNAMLVLIDGVAINDPTQPTFDMNSIAIGTAERIEVLLGAQSAMYGAGAMAGVINIITKEGEGALNGSVYLEGGYPTNGKLQAQVNGSNNKLAYNLGLTGRYSNAISAYNSNSGDAYSSDELDPFYDVNLNASVKYTASDMFNVRLTLNETYQNYAYDTNYDYSYSDDPYFTTLRSLVSVKPELILMDGFWTQSLNLSYLNTQRAAWDYNYNSSTSASAWSTANFKSQGMRADWQHKLAFDKQNIALGALYQFDQQIENDRALDGAGGEYNINNFAGYAEYSVNPIESLYINASARVDYFDNLESLGLSGSAAIAYTLPSNTLFRASIGRGFNAPNIDQLSNTLVELEPETSLTWDIGLTQPVGNIAKISLGYYQAYYDNLIYNIGYGTPYINGSEQESQGISAGLSVTPIKALNLSLSGTYEIPKDYADNRPIRVPDYTATFDADYSLPVGNNALVGLSVKYVGDRDDLEYFTDWNGAPVTLDPYTLLNFRAQADVIDNLTLFLKVNNILNQEYEEVYGYSTLGINANLGVKYVF